MAVKNDFFPPFSELGIGFDAVDGMHSRRSYVSVSFTTQKRREGAFLGSFHLLFIQNKMK